MATATTRRWLLTTNLWKKLWSSQAPCQAAGQGWWNLEDCRFGWRSLAPRLWRDSQHHLSIKTLANCCRIYICIYTYITKQNITCHYITLHYIALHCIALHCIALRYIHYIHTLHIYLATYRPTDRQTDRPTYLYTSIHPYMYITYMYVLMFEFWKGVAGIHRWKVRNIHSHIRDALPRWVSKSWTIKKYHDYGSTYFTHLFRAPCWNGHGDLFSFWNWPEVGSIFQGSFHALKS